MFFKIPLLETVRQQEQGDQAGPHGPTQHEGEGHHPGPGLQLPDGARQGLPREGHACGEEGDGRAVRNQNPEEGHHHPG